MKEKEPKDIVDYGKQEADDRMEQDAQIASEEQVPEPKKGKKEFPF